MKNKILNYKINNFSEMLKSLRLSKGFTQKELSKKAGLWYREGRNVTHAVTEYEIGRKYPDVKAIYNLSKILGIDKDDLFNMVLKEMIRKYNLRASVLYINAQNGKEANFNIGFCSSKREMKLYYPKTAERFLSTRKKYGLSRTEILKLIKKETGFEYSRNSVFNAEKGKKCSIKFLINYFTALGEDPFPVFKMLMGEKLICHVVEFQSLWEEYKKNVDLQKICDTI